MITAVGVRLRVKRGGVRMRASCQPRCVSPMAVWWFASSPPGRDDNKIVFLISIPLATGLGRNWASFLVSYSTAKPTSDYCCNEYSYCGSQVDYVVTYSPIVEGCMSRAKVLTM